MRTLIRNVLILVSWSGTIPMMAQLPPEILADSHLLRAEQAIREGDPTRARSEIDKIILLQKDHELNLSAEFHFRSAKVAGTVDLPEQALEFVTKYLTAAGRDGMHYVEAVELMNQAKDAVAGRNGQRANSSGQPPPPSKPIVSAETTEVSQVPGCKGWNTEKFYERATIFAGGGKTRDCLAAGANVMARDGRGRTPLHYASVKGRYRSSKVLLEEGADLEARDKDGRMPLHLAMRSIHGYGKQINTLLKAGADVNARDHEGRTPLHIAANRGYKLKQGSKLLLEAGADLEARDNQGRTPLHVAGSEGYNLKDLLKAGANMKARDDLGQTPLHHAAGYIHDSNVKDLLKAGADLEARDNQGRTPLDIAKSSGRRESFPGVARTLIKAGSKPTRRESGPGWLGTAIGIAGGAAIAAAGGGTEEATATGTVFAERVIRGQPADGGAGGGNGSIGNVGTMSGGGRCEIPGYPRPADVKNLGLSWCPATVNFQVRAFALQAAGAQCAIATGSSSAPEQIQARRQEIQAACARLEALGVSNCRCP